MELVTKLSYIEEVQDSVKKRYNSLKAEIIKNGSLTDVKKQRSASFATEMGSIVFLVDIEVPLY